MIDDDPTKYFFNSIIYACVSRTETYTSKSSHTLGFVGKESAIDADAAERKYSGKSKTGKLIIKCCLVKLLWHIF